MALEIVVTTDRYSRDPASRDMIEVLKRDQEKLDLQSAVLYYDFPAYVDYESATTRPDILIFSPCHGFIAIRFLDDSLFFRNTDTPLTADAALVDFCSNLYSRLIRSRELRSSLTRSIFEVHPIIFDKTTKNLSDSCQTEFNSKICKSYEQFGRILSSAKRTRASAKIEAEARSVVEGAKALARPHKRAIPNPEKQPLAVALSELEAEIANFDQKQRHIALVDVGGPARIRGLAGSGKTIILAMKAAHLHLNNPDALILITFLTKSLRATIKSLITKFYRHYSDKDPNWKVIHIRHGWGGVSIPGVYSDASSRANRPALRLPDAQRLAKAGESAFGTICRELLENAKIDPFYDHILIDEGQDFAEPFYELCFKLAKGERDQKSIVWAYDELQDIMKVKIRQPEQLFGMDFDKKPRVSLERSGGSVPPGATNDAILEKCYRNQRDVLVVAHALGFGVYGNIVQLLESAEHWTDVGYEVLTGELVVGQEVRVIRPERNSPIQISSNADYPLIEHYAAASIDAEVDWVIQKIQGFIQGGLAPEEIVVISLDDRHAKNYLSRVAESLALIGIASNNVIADPYNEPPFSVQGKITLSTVYRAKGNEAAAIFEVGIDAVETRSRDGRNKIFTAFTRSKAWLRVSGLGVSATKIFLEIDKALRLSPEIKFTMPNLDEIETIQRGLGLKQARAKAAREEFLKKLRAAGLSEDEIQEEWTLGLKSE